MDNIILVGFMGTGKTTTGQLLADRLEWTFIDVDQAIETECGMCVGDIFRTYGEAYFRETEKIVIKRLCSRRKLVIATGGGAVLSDENVRNLQQSGTVVTLEASPEAVLQRVANDPTPRPLLACSDKQAAIRQLMQGRAARYKIADLYIDTSSITPESVADMILDFIRKRTPDANLDELGIAPKQIIGKTEHPLICAPLVGADNETLQAELAQILLKKPDVLEWRADFFTAIADTEAVVATAKRIKETAGDVPLIFTIRSVREGGQPISLQEEEVSALNIAVCRQTDIEYIDCELSADPTHIDQLRVAAAACKKKIIGSFHDFSATPSREALVAKLAEAQDRGLDVAKAAVMPQNPEDVLTLLGATLEAKQRLAIPVITMSMGPYGAVSRLIGGVFGSCLSFAVGANASAPGQVPIEDLRMALEIVERAMGGKMK